MAQGEAPPGGKVEKTARGRKDAPELAHGARAGAPGFRRLARWVTTLRNDIRQRPQRSAGGPEAQPVVEIADAVRKEVVVRQPDSLDPDARNADAIAAERIDGAA